MSKQKWIEVGCRFSVAGVQYSDYQRVIDKMKLGERVAFIGELNNAFDNRAIRIEYKGTKIGYVPARTQEQSTLWHEHNKGSKCLGVITAVNKNNPSWHLITLQILVARPKQILSPKEGEVLFANMRADLSYGRGWNDTQR